MTDNTPTSAAPTRAAILVAAFDSQLKWAGAIRRALESRGFACRVIVPSDIRHAISDGQLADYSGDAAAYMPWTELVIASLHVDVVVAQRRRAHARQGEDRRAAGGRLTGHTPTLLALNGPLTTGESSLTLT